MNTSNRIVVTGVGAISPFGVGRDPLWRAMVEGASGAGPITYFDTADFETKFACEVKGFNVEEHLDRKSANRMDRYAQYGVVAAEQALKDAELDLKEIDTARFGVVYGSGIGGMISYDAQFRNYMEGGPRRVSPFFVPLIIPDMAAGLISTVQMGFLGAVITFAPRPMYAPHFLTTIPWGLTPLQDQQLGGVVMWVPGCLAFLAVALWGIYPLMSEAPARRAAPMEPAAP